MLSLHASHAGLVVVAFASNGHSMEGAFVDMRARPQHRAREGAGGVVRPLALPPPQVKGTGSASSWSIRAIFKSSECRLP